MTDKIYPKTIRELLSLPVESCEIDCEVFMHSRLKFFPKHVDDDNFGCTFHSDKCDESGRLVTHWLKDFDFDGRRVYQYAYVTLDNEPKFIFYRYGRDGCDGYGITFIGKDARKEVEAFLDDFMTYDDIYYLTQDNVVELDTEISDGYTLMYGYDILSEFKHW